MGQMHLSPLLPAPFEPLPSSWACCGLRIGASLWCPGMGQLGTPHQRAEHLAPELPWGEGYWEQTGGIALEGQNQPGRCALRHLASRYSCHLGEGRGVDRGFLECGISLMFGATEGCSPAAKAEGAAGDKHADLAF